jgi:CDP-6-deoxy-D-xylo-4-hexulose-3-dehydrase
VLGLAQLARIDDFIVQRNKNFRAFVAACSQYREELLILDRPGMSSFVLPFFFKDRQRKEAFQAVIREGGIESRPLISGNLLRQPFLSCYYNDQDFPNADFIHTNAFYIGNNQFVDGKRLDVLFPLMHDFFGSRS